jgi:hypothetical protein
LPAEPAPWDVVDHLWDHGRAPHNPKHADHMLARIIERGVMALLPSLPQELLARIVRVGLGYGADGNRPLDADTVARLLGTAEFPGTEPLPADLAETLASDRFRAALGRIACFYDGGHIVEGD